MTGSATGSTTDEATAIDALLVKAAGRPLAMLHLARRLKAIGRRARAAAVCADLLDLPDVPDFVAIGARTIVAAGIPGFHSPMVFDRIRNHAYQAALERMVRPGMRVLEIGTGAGLLAMMAVRAGADHVHSCEVDPLLARVATDVVAANGLSDRITIHACHSTALDADRDLGGRADLLVSEIIGHRLINEAILSSHAHAAAALLAPGAAIVPLRGSIRVALAELDSHRLRAMTDVEGFDLSAFERLRAPRWTVPVASPALVLRSDPADLFAFPFDGSAPPSGSATLALRTHGGRVNGVVQWIAFDLDATTSYDNTPGPDAASHWAPEFHPLPAARDTLAGAAIDVHGRYDGSDLTIWTG